MSCPASYWLEKNLPAEWQYNPWVDKGNYGSAVHALGEAALRMPKKLTAAQVKKLIVASGLKGDEAGRAEHTVKVYDAYIRGLVKKVKGHLSIEVKNRWHGTDLECVAKCDALIETGDCNKTTLHVIDLKTGAFDYSESVKKQLVFGGLVNILTTTLEPAQHYGIVGHVVQPGYYNAPQQAVNLGTLWAGTRADAANELVKMKSVIETEVVNKGDHCSFCRALPKCPLHTALALAYDADLQPAIEMSIERLDYIVRSRKNIDRFLDACEAQAKTLIDSGAQFPTLGLVPVISRRRWINEDETIKAFHKDFGYEIYEPLKLKSPAQLEKIVGKKNIEGLTEQPTTMKIGVVNNPFKEIAQ